MNNDILQRAKLYNFRTMDRADIFLEPKANVSGPGPSSSYICDSVGCLFFFHTVNMERTEIKDDFILSSGNIIVSRRKKHLHYLAKVTKGLWQNAK